jgi:hypothetical protein
MIYGEQLCATKYKAQTPIYSNIDSQSNLIYGNKSKE